MRGIIFLSFLSNRDQEFKNVWAFQMGNYQKKKRSR